MSYICKNVVCSFLIFKGLKCFTRADDMKLNVATVQENIGEGILLFDLDGVEECEATCRWVNLNILIDKYRWWIGLGTRET